MSEVTIVSKRLRLRPVRSEVVGLSRTDFDAGIVPDIEIAWRLAFDQWGDGYATEAAAAVIGDGFGRLGLVTIVGVTTPDNLRSRKVMVRLGMKFSPDEMFEHALVPKGDPARTHVVYRLSRDPWAVNRGRRSGMNEAPDP